MTWPINWPRPPPMAAWPLPLRIGRFAKKTSDTAASGLGRWVLQSWNRWFKIKIKLERQECDKRPATTRQFAQAGT
jgi:hypothetical protein